MKPSTVQQRREKTLRQAVISLYNGMSVRKAASVYRLPKSTIHEAFYAPMIPRFAPQHRRALDDEEEGRIVKLLLKSADVGHPLTFRHVEDAVKVVVSHMDPLRRMRLPFRDGVPGIKFFRQFMKRHKEKLAFLRPLKQDYLRFKAVNADALCEHFSSLEKLVKENDLDPGRIWDLDECGVTPSRDANGRSQKKRITRANTFQDVRITHFAYDKRVTFMPVISAAGGSGPCLFVFKGKKFPYRSVLRGGTEKIDSLADHLPRSSVISMREEGGGVDSRNFLWWAGHFVEFIAPLTAGGKKVLLIYDGYRSHMSLEVLTLFADSNVIVYALPAHTSGKLQPLDVVAFSSFKRKLNDIVHQSSAYLGDKGADVYDVSDMIRKAYVETFTSVIIKSSFKRAGLWPINPTLLMSVPRPLDDAATSVATVEGMEKMMNKRRQEFARSVFGDRVTILGNGYVDTAKGAVLNCEKAIRLIKERATAQINLKRQEDLQREERRKRAAVREELDRKRAITMRRNADCRRASLAGFELEDYRQQLRPMKQRRAAARVRTAQKRLFSSL